MKLLINNKPFEKWDINDLNLIISNEDYKESDYIDYKENFSFLEITDKKVVREKIAEFKHDLCSFANAEGGYIFFGIKEEKGIPKIINGIQISGNDTDKFELDIKNKMFGIEPAIPQINMRFLKLTNDNYVVVLEIMSGVFSPYVFKKNENDYNFWKRRGNSKVAMSYNEIRNMYIQSMSLSSCIDDFRDERTEHYNTETKDYLRDNSGRYLLLHIIPLDFISSEPFNKLYLNHKTKTLISRHFNKFCFGTSVPNIDGIKYPEYYGNGLAVQFYNNGIAELFVDCKKSINEKDNKKYIAKDQLGGYIVDFLKAYFNAIDLFTKAKTLYICFSLVGCVDVISDSDFMYDYENKIDRFYVECTPIELFDVSDENQRNESIKNLLMEFALGLSLKNPVKYVSEFEA